MNRNNNDIKTSDINAFVMDFDDLNKQNKSEALVEMSDDLDITLSNKLTPDEADEEPVDSDMNSSQQTVQVDGDPFHICLSSTNLDQSLLEYLQQHPTTKECVIFFNFKIGCLNFLLTMEVTHLELEF